MAIGFPFNADREEIGTASGKLVGLELAVAYRIPDVPVFHFGEV